MSLNKRNSQMNEEEFKKNRDLYKHLKERVKQLRIKELFEEPSTYEDDGDNDFTSI